MSDNGIIKALMESKGLKVADTAKDIEISPSYLYLILKGYDPPLSKKLKLAKSLNVSVTYLFKLTEPEIKAVYGIPQAER